MRILFVCKYNRFRSQFAERYFKKINRNKRIKAESAGIIEVNKPLTPDEKERNKFIKERFGLKLRRRSRGVNAKLLESVDKIIVTADDVPKEIFSGRKWKEKVSVWKIKDEKAADKKNVNKLGKLIIKKVDVLVKSLKENKK